jgi:hypothetical protein
MTFFVIDDTVCRHAAVRAAILRDALAALGLLRMRVVVAATSFVSTI